LYRRAADTPWGFKFVGDKRMMKGCFEEEERGVIENALAWCDVFVNIGANAGYYVAFAAQKKKYTLAFEPDERNLRYLYKNVMMNDLGGFVEIYPVALSDKIGIATIYGSGTLASLVPGWAGIPLQNQRFVPTNTLDTILQSRFTGKKCFILCDIEGSEYNMLKGAIEILKMKPKPLWIMEINVWEHQPAGINVNPYLIPTFETFWDEGYASWTATRIPQRVGPEEIRRLQTKENKLPETRNFIFLDPGNDPLHIK